MTQADRIRRYVAQGIIAPARARGLGVITVRAGDVHHALKLNRAYPAVCSVLRGGKLMAEAEVTLVGTEGPANGSNVYFRFDLGGAGQHRSRRRSDADEPTQKSAPPADAQLDWSRSLVLVSCTKAKRSGRMAAQNLYSSPAFLMKKKLIHRCKADWMILSAKHGLLDPSAEIEPYDQTLTDAGVTARRQWAKDLLPDLLPVARRHGSVVLLAGDKYAEHLITPLRDAGVQVHRPLAGLRQGEQLQWLADRQ